jgi:hypothetical protein
MERKGDPEETSGDENLRFGPASDQLRILVAIGGKGR